MGNKVNKLSCGTIHKKKQTAVDDSPYIPSSNFQDFRDGGSGQSNDRPYYLGYRRPKSFSSMPDVEPEGTIFSPTRSSSPNINFLFEDGGRSRNNSEPLSYNYYKMHGFQREQMMSYLPSADNIPFIDASRANSEVFNRSYIAFLDASRANSEVFNHSYSGFTPAHVRPSPEGGSTVFKFDKCEGIHIGDQSIHNTSLLVKDSAQQQLENSSEFKLKQWKMTRTVHQSTRAQKDAFNILKEHQFVVIAGRKGDGKTSIARDIILNYTETIDEHGDHKTLVVEIEDPNDILEICSKGIESPIIFLADDALGKSAVDNQKLDKWQRKADDVGAALHDSAKLKLVITMRKHIWNKTKGLLDGYDVFRYLVDLTCDEMALKTDEKASILRAHLKKNRLDSVEESVIREVSETFPTSPGYPQCCSMFSRVQVLYSEGVQFFKKPSSFLQKLLEELYAAEPNLYMTLALTLVFRGQFKIKYFSKENLDKAPGVKACVEEIMECCGRDNRSSIGQLQRSFEQVRGVYFKEDEEQRSFCFNHDSIEEAVAKHFGDKHPEVLIKCCHIKSLQQWVCTAEEHLKDHDQHVVFLHKGHFLNLAERLNKELFTGSADVAFSLISAQDINFVAVWIQSLKGLTNHDELLKKEGHNMFVQASKNGVELFVNYLLEKPQRALLCLGQCKIDEAMIAATCNGHLRVMEVLDHLCVSQTALERAFGLVIEIGLLDSFKFLLDCSPQLQNIPVRMTSCENISLTHSLQLAAYHGSLEIVEYLLSIGTDPNLFDSRGKTALHHGCENGYSAVAELLLSHPEIDISLEDFDKMTALDYAIREAHEEVVHQLKRHQESQRA